MVAQNVFRARSVIALTVAGLLALPLRVYATSFDETALDSFALIQMEHRVDLADQREQCYLYAEVLHGLTELAGRQVAASQFDDATATLRQMDMVANKLQAASARDAKRLKNVEQLLEHTAHRFNDVVRTVSVEDRATMQKTLRHLDALHTEVLEKVFAK